MPRKRSAASKAKREAKVVENKDVAETQLGNHEIKENENRNNSENESSSSSEDEYGELVTEDIEKGINEVMRYLKTEPKKLLDTLIKFFKEPEELEYKSESKEKPMYLKDYHRMNLLNSMDKTKEDSEDKISTEPKSYVENERSNREDLISDIQKQFTYFEKDENDDDFLVKKVVEADDTVTEPIKIILPDPETNREEFLAQFLNRQAWIPRKGDEVIELDKIDNNDDKLFDDAVEQFENAYNFRYEDPNASEIVSYARNLASVRRSATSSRKRKREKKKEEKLKEEAEKAIALKKKKTSKINKVYDRLMKIKEAVGEHISEEHIKHVFGDLLLEDDFDSSLWDEKMNQIFDESFYNEENEKPQWGQDDEIMEDFYQEDSETSQTNVDSSKNIVPGLPGDNDDLSRDSSKASKREKKSDKRALREKAERIVESNVLKLVDEVEEERGRKNIDDIKFKYREVSPESFGLTTRDIFLADDKDLNKFAGVKKFAPYRPRELITKDRRKLSKKKRIEEWRKEAINSLDFPTGNEDDIWIAVEKPHSKKSEH